MAKKQIKKPLNTETKVGIGFGLTAAAAAAAGAYFLYGSKNAPKNRKKVKGWALKAKGEVLEGLEKAKEITTDEFNDLVATASKAYGTVKKATAGEVKDFKKEMQTHWHELEKSKVVKKIAGGKQASRVKKVVKKVVKKMTKAKKTATKK